MTGDGPSADVSRRGTIGAVGTAALGALAGCSDLLAGPNGDLPNGDKHLPVDTPVNAEITGFNVSRVDETTVEAEYELTAQEGDRWAWNLAPAWLNATTGMLYFHDLLETSPGVRKSDWEDSDVITKTIELTVQEPGTVLVSPYIGYHPPYPLWGVDLDE